MFRFDHVMKQLLSVVVYQWPLENFWLEIFRTSLSWFSVILDVIVHLYIDSQESWRRKRTMNNHIYRKVLSIRRKTLKFRWVLFVHVIHNEPLSFSSQILLQRFLGVSKCGLHHLEKK